MLLAQMVLAEILLVSVLISMAMLEAGERVAGRRQTPAGLGGAAVAVLLQAQARHQARARLVVQQCQQAPLQHHMLMQQGRGVRLAALGATVFWGLGLAAAAALLAAAVISLLLVEAGARS